jgi:hypothetical protein
MNELSIPSVSYVYYWGTHTPWLGSPTDGKEPSEDVGVLLSEDNTILKPTGHSTRLVNKHMLDRIVATTRVSQYIRGYATADNDGAALNLFLLNKNNQPQEAVITLDNDSAQQRIFTQTLLQGRTWDDPALSLSHPPKILQTDTNHSLKLTLPPLSILVLSSDTASIQNL